MTAIQTRYDRIRGCGWRQPGGMYLVSDGLMASCGRLYLPLTVCHICGYGIKPARGWTWVKIPTFVLEADPTFCDKRYCEQCPLCPVREEEAAGLLWCGKAFYKTPEDWIREANEQGVSRRIGVLPHGFEAGKAWVLIAHREAIQGVNEDGKIVMQPGSIHAFKPQAVEYVVRGNETEEELASMEKRGITPVRIEQIVDQQALAL